MYVGVHACCAACDVALSLVSQAAAYVELCCPAQRCEKQIEAAEAARCRNVLCYMYMYIYIYMVPGSHAPPPPAPPWICFSVF